MWKELIFPDDKKLGMLDVNSFIFSWFLSSQVRIWNIHWEQKWMIVGYFFKYFDQVMFELKIFHTKSSISFFREFWERNCLIFFCCKKKEDFKRDFLFWKIVESKKKTSQKTFWKSGGPFNLPTISSPGNVFKILDKI